MSITDRLGPLFQPRYGFLLFIFSLIYFLFFVFPVLHNALGIINFSETASYLLPILVMDLPVGIPLFLLMFRETRILDAGELAMVVLGLSIFAALIGFGWMYINLFVLAEEDPTEVLSYEGDDIFDYLNPLLRNECVYGEIYLPPSEFDDCVSLTSMALLVRYFIYLGPHNPLTLFVGGYISWRLFGR